ncbi:DUF448 domain-containing protein [Geothermobacter ehrlichii]|uniref:DUF448 domain-containing protein n=1 Tax=Geothermobacter ehrlichii TaxID=213224 RepID=UPI001652F7DE|nr:YlxR family protein [Geothermobacter ehrlichii]
MRRRPQRTCLGCRESFDQDRLIRLVAAPDDRLLVDYRGRLPGRGAYVCPNGECIARAVVPGRLSRAFRREGIRADAQDLREQLAGQIRDKISSLLGMARKAGQVVVGSNLVTDSLARGNDLALVVIARDISPGIREKVERKRGEVGFFYPDWLAKADIGRILGRAECSVMGIRPGSVADALSRELSRFNTIAGDS